MCDTENLIICVQSFPCIWDTGIEEYHDREKKDAAWSVICKNLIANWDTLNDKEKKIKGQDVRRKWSNCRDYYRKFKQKVNNCPSGSAASKSKKYVFADILNFLDKTITNRTHEGNYEEEGDANESLLMDDLLESEEEIVKPTGSEQKKIKINEDKKKTKKVKAQDVPGEILNLLKKPKSTKDYDDDEKYLLSFSGDMKKMTHQQKLGFKLGMMQLLQNTFQETPENIPPASYIPIPSPSPGIRYSQVYKDDFHRFPQSSYSIPHKIITIPRPQKSPMTSTFYDTNPSQNQRVVINSIKTVTTDKTQQSCNHESRNNSSSQNTSSNTNQVQVRLSDLLPFK